MAHASTANGPYLLEALRLPIGDHSLNRRSSIAVIPPAGMLLTDPPVATAVHFI